MIARGWGLVLLALVTAGCRNRSYDKFRDANFSATVFGDAAIATGMGETVFTVPPRDGPMASPMDACFPRREQCNGRDDDCDGQVDDGFDFFTDPDNCGLCDHACAFTNAVPLCSAGRCRFDSCSEGFVDLDRFAGNGCECALTENGIEICDGRDNDCDGNVDEGFDLQTSLEHCGACARSCAAPHAASECSRGLCRMGACEPGYFDLDRVARNGCEYACVPGGVEICDGLDNDCNGQIDESDVRVGQRCFPAGVAGCDAATLRCATPCGLGLWACRSGGLMCLGAILPGVEICNGRDDNCDGQSDEGFDLQSDPRWCGACGRACDLANAVPSCVTGRCQVRACRTGFVDLDRAPDNGCEYACTPDGPEVCDGRDNDCDGQTDLNDDDLLYPTVNFCKQMGECGKGPGGSTRFPGVATFPACVQSSGATRPDWICTYPPGVQLFSANIIAGIETFCDGLDNDCDGAVDEDFKPALGDVCQGGGVGLCRKTGKWRCAGQRDAPLVCDVAGVPDLPVRHEICDGKDNDCDGLVDESWDTAPGGGPLCEGGVVCRGVRDDVVHVSSSGKDFYIYQYESSRVDASSDLEGILDLRSCSRRPPGGVLPWTNVTFSQAQVACAGAGMRLCRTTRDQVCSSAKIIDDEWGLACTAGLTCPDGLPRPYPYACTYDAAICSGRDAARPGAIATGTLAQCTTPDLDLSSPVVDAASDLSGNVSEWTDDCRGTLNDGTNRKIYTLRGGSFTHTAQALRCDFQALVVADTFAFPDTGFRCCSSCPPGQADCGGVCVNLGADAAHCGKCGAACGSGRCVNGACF